MTLLGAHAMPGTTVQKQSCQRAERGLTQTSVIVVSGFVVIELVETLLSGMEVGFPTDCQQQQPLPQQPSLTQQNKTIKSSRNHNFCTVRKRYETRHACNAIQTQRPDMAWLESNRTCSVTHGGITNVTPRRGPQNLKLEATLREKLC